LTKYATHNTNDKEKRIVLPSPDGNGRITNHNIFDHSHLSACQEEATKKVNAMMSPANCHVQQTNHQEYIVNLNPADVVLGRGAGPNEHSGNIAFREIVLDLKPTYIATVNRKMKSQIATKVVKAIRARGGRFLKHAPGRDDSVFVLADEDVVVEKAKQALRHLRCTVKPRKGRVSSVSRLSSASIDSALVSHYASPISPAASMPIVFENAPTTQSPTEVAATATSESNLLNMALLVEQYNAVVPPLRRDTITISQDAPPGPCPVSASSLHQALQNSSSYQETLQLLIALAESKRRQSATAECLQLLELAETLIAAKRAKESTSRALPQVPPEASLVPCDLLAHLLLSQQHQEKQQLSFPPQPSLVFPSSSPYVTGVNPRLWNESTLAIHALHKAC
jgi:hypothetical protein